VGNPETSSFRLSQPGLERLAGLLSQVLCGARIERVWRPGRELVVLRTTARDKRRLLLDACPPHPRATLTAEWPENPHDADQATLLLRGLVEGARILGVTAVDQRGLGVLLETRQGPLTLRAQLAGRYTNLALTAGEPGASVRWQLLPDRPPVDSASPPLVPGPDAWVVAQGDLQELDGRWREAALAHDRKLAHLALRRQQREVVKRLERREAALAGELAKIEGADRDRELGELLKTGLGRVGRGATAVRVPDWTQDGLEVEVPLDPRLDARQNLERYFHRYRRLHGQRHDAAARLEATRAKLRVEQRGLAEIDAIDPALPASDDALAQLSPKLVLPRPAGPKREALAASLPYRRFLAADGTPILVGKSARHNEALTFQVARGRDLWLHARDHAGSHVVVVAPGRGEVTPETLLDAALLAAWHSKARGEAAVDVMWTQAKHVKKARDAGPGRVQVAGQRHLTVRQDAERLARLYATAEAEAESA
jgi:predicted ribosome quality control (RQC) complex YloA/Tae2 family protein